MINVKLEKVEKQASLRDRIVQTMADAIIAGEFRPGTLLSVPSLAADFDVSATPVREAMLDLEQRGFVVPVRNKGFRVTSVSEHDLREILEVRELLEAPVMAAIAGTVPAEELPKWRAMAEEISRHAADANVVPFLEVDREFHLGLLAIHGNARLVALVRELRSQTRMIGLTKMAHSPELGMAADEHHLMLDLIERGEAEELRALTVTHFAHIMSWWGEFSDS